MPNKEPIQGWQHFCNWRKKCFLRKTIQRWIYEVAKIVRNCTFHKQYVHWLYRGPLNKWMTLSWHLIHVVHSLSTCPFRPSEITRHFHLTQCFGKLFNRPAKNLIDFLSFNLSNLYSGFNYWFRRVNISLASNRWYKFWDFNRSRKRCWRYMMFDMFVP